MAVGGLCELFNMIPEAVLLDSPSYLRIIFFEKYNEHASILWFKLIT